MKHGGDINIPFFIINLSKLHLILSLCLRRSSLLDSKHIDYIGSSKVRLFVGHWIKYISQNVKKGSTAAKNELN